MEIASMIDYIVGSPQSVSESRSDLQGSPRVYPLVNHTALIHLTPDDLIRPGEYGWMISTLPMFQVLLNIAAFIIWIIIFLYIWKVVYYPVADPYASPGGVSLPYQKRVETLGSLLETVYDALARFSEEGEQ